MEKEQVQKLIERIRTGDNQVLGAIYTEYRKPFLRFAQSFNLEKEDLLDLYQDSILAFVDNIKNGKIDTLNSSLKTYIFSIGKYMAYKKLKRQAKMEQSPLDSKRLSLYMEEIEDNNEYDKEEIELFNTCFSKLGKQCQKLLKLYYYRGFTMDEIQKELAYDNYNVVKSQKSRCLKQLKLQVNNLKNES